MKILRVLVQNIRVNGDRAAADSSFMMRAKPRILFVDDEVAVLDGLRNLLRKQRGAWDLSFANGGAAALAALDRDAFDVIVTDMRMPGMDGAALLHATRERHPSVTRIILSGHADRALVTRALPVAHQFLGKPCEPELLRAVLERACALHALVADPSLRGLVGSLERVPSPPRTYHRLVATLAASNATVAALANIVEEDMALSAKILQLVNSAYFGLSQRMTSIRDAIRYLGVDLLASLALSANVLAEPSVGDVISIDRLQADAILTARIAARLAGGGRAADDAFSAGLLHDIGKVVLAAGRPAEYRKLLAEAARTRVTVEVAERAALGVSHAEVGAYLLGLWGVPMAVVDAVARHHDVGATCELNGGVVPYVHAAHALVAGEEPDAAMLARAGLGDQLASWRAITRDEIARMTARESAA